MTPFTGPKTYTGPTALSVNNAWAKLNGNTWAPGVVELPANPPSQRYVFYYTAESTVPGSGGFSVHRTGDRCLT